MQFTFGEINIICSDLEKSLHFYRDILGFTPTTDDEGFYHLQFGGNHYLLLPIAHPNEKTAPYGSIPQFSMDLMAENLEEAFTYFKENGVTFAKEWQAGAAMFVIRDPGGLPWEIIGSSV